MMSQVYKCLLLTPHAASAATEGMMDQDQWRSEADLDPKLGEMLMDGEPLTDGPKPIPVDVDELLRVVERSSWLRKHDLTVAQLAAHIGARNEWFRRNALSIAAEIRRLRADNAELRRQLAAQGAMAGQLLSFVENIIRNYDHEPQQRTSREVCYDSCRRCQAEQLLEELGAAAAATPGGKVSGVTSKSGIVS